MCEIQHVHLHMIFNIFYNYIYQSISHNTHDPFPICTKLSCSRQSFRGAISKASSNSKFTHTISRFESVFTVDHQTRIRYLIGFAFATDRNCIRTNDQIDRPNRTSKLDQFLGFALCIQISTLYLCI